METKYIKITCIECNGTGETDSYVGQCWKCRGDGYIFIEAPTDVNINIVER